MIAQWIIAWSGERQIGFFLTHLVKINFSFSTHMVEVFRSLSVERT
jgi:hypothetical protein